MSKPKINAEGQKELDRIDGQINQFTESMHVAVQDGRTLAIQESEPQTKKSQQELKKEGVIYLKPKRTVFSREKFNEKFRQQFNEKSTYVEFIAENKEVIGESIDFWTKPFPGIPAEEWIVPVNKTVSAPLYVKERIQDCGYTIFRTSDTPVQSEGGVVYYGQMVAEERKQRLDAREVSKSTRISVGNRFAA
jgi:hypothetical protein